MLGHFEDELTCDLAENYGIFDLRSLRPQKLAILSRGLRDSSRTKMKIAGIPAPLEAVLLAHIADELAAILYAGSKKQPASMLDMVLGRIERETASFASGEEFKKKRKKILEGLNGNANR